MIAIQETTNPTIVEIADVGKDDRRHGRLSLRLQSVMPLEAQIKAMGATWLDRHLVGELRSHLVEDGFGSEVRQALRQRQAFLLQEGLATREGEQAFYRCNLLAYLREREMEAAARHLAREIRLAHRPPPPTGPDHGNLSTVRRSRQRAVCRD